MSSDLVYVCFTRQELGGLLDVTRSLITEQHNRIEDMDDVKKDDSALLDILYARLRTLSNLESKIELAINAAG
jgi:hypothetical protein